MFSLTIFMPVFFAAAGVFFNDSAARAMSIFAAGCGLLLLVLFAIFGVDFYALSLSERFGFGLILSASHAAYALAIVAAFMLFASSIFFRFGKDELVCSQLLLACMNGLFFADDALLFYIFWEASLLPLLYLMMRAGQSAQAQRFFVFAFAGSIFMLVSIIYLALHAAGEGQIMSFAIANFSLDDIPASVQTWLFFAFVLAFAIKAPIFPLHSWAIKTYSKAPNFVSVMLASFKMAPFGFLKFMPLFSAQYEQFGGVLVAFCAASAIYCAVLALSANCYKELCAMSSISHLGVICAGIFVGTPLAIAGALFYMIAHALISGGMFFFAEIFRLKFASYELTVLKNLARLMPFGTLLFAVLLFSSISLPFTVNFVGEFLVLSQLFAAYKTAGVVATLVVIAGSIYMLVFFRRCFLTPLAPKISCVASTGALCGLSNFATPSGHAGCEQPHSAQAGEYERMSLRASWIFILSLLCVASVLLGVLPANLLAYLEVF